MRVYVRKKCEVCGRVGHRTKTHKLYLDAKKYEMSLEKMSRMKRQYRLSPKRYRKMLIAQEGLCAICKVSPATDIDHNHRTKKVRGLLCSNCNRGIGFLRDNPDVIDRAANYIRESNISKKRK
jgi:hypothetical protein